MRKTIALVLFIIGSIFTLLTPAEAKIVSVKSYYKPSINRYVAPSYRTSPNKYRYDNYSAKGNYNPFTGKKGYSKW